MGSDLMPRFRERLGEIMDLRSALSVLHWDQEVFMPPKAAPGRGRQVATLSALAHRMFTSDEFGGMLLDLAGQIDTLHADEAKLVSETLHDFKRATKLPAKFVERFAEEQSKAFHAWVGARKASDFKQFEPHLAMLLDLLQQQADYLGYEASPYDALLEEYERGMTAARLKTIFGELASAQSALVARIGGAAQMDTAWTEQEWPEQAQWDFSLRVLRDMGYDLEAGRQDRSVHPFTTNFDVYDVRITTRTDPRDLFSGLTGSIHEGGHALYEQGFREEDRRTTLAEAPSLGIHESQSRMWENMIGRGLAFWEHYMPAFREAFPGQLDGIAPEQVYQAVNRVAPSLIRVEADECTYNLHVILRFEIEVGLMEGTIRVAEVPEAWNAKVKEYLGLDVPDDAQGCLQDIHWSHGSIGYFPTYALGNVYAAQLFEKILVDVPDLWGQVREGDFGGLLGWLRSRVHQCGRRKTATEIVRDATGKEPESGPYLRYLEEKYAALYGLGA